MGGGGGGGRWAEGSGVEEAKDQSRLGEGGAIRVSCYLGNPFHPALLPKKVENCKT